MRWSAQSGVSRYRFQLARDRKFNDIVVDRVVSGTEGDAEDLAAGSYFWRVAALDGRLGQFSTPQIVEASKAKPPVIPEPRVTDPPKLPTPLPRVTPDNPTTNLPTLVSDGGWRAAIGNVSKAMPAHLRSAATTEIVALNSDGVLFALDAMTGVTLWATRTGARSGAKPFVILVPSAAGNENIVIPFDAGVRALEGATGRELWRVPMTSVATNGVTVSLSNNTTAVFVFSNLAERLVVLDGGNGKLLAEAKLPAKVFGAPVPFAYKGVQGVLIGFEDGRVEVRDRSGIVVRSGSVNSPATTSPLFVNSQRGLVLVGARNGLNALDADNLHALGRVALKDDAPRGTLVTADLDGNGASEIVMITERGQVMAINASDGKIRWEHAGALETDAAAAVDLNADGGEDVIVAAGESFAMALSGRDGSMIWKDEQASTGNHSALPLRPIVAIHAAARTMIVGSDPSGGILRGVLLKPRLAIAR